MKTSEELKKIHDEHRNDYPEDFNIRLRRALSWLKKSEIEKDPDGKFIFLWISLNCTYSTNNNDPTDSTSNNDPTDTNLRDYYLALCNKNGSNEINEIIQKDFQDEIYDIITNEYIMPSYWYGIGWSYETRKVEDKKKAFKALDREEPLIILKMLFINLYILRNQIFHGNATYKGSRNRKTVCDGSNILQDLVPLFIEIMMKNPKDDWGKVNFHPDGPRTVD
jgi:hypothetical protein